MTPKDFHVFAWALILSVGGAVSTASLIYLMTLLV